MTLTLEIVPNDGPGQPWVVRVLRSYGRGAATRTAVIECNDAPDPRGAMWLGIRALDALYHQWHHERLGVDL